ncbi:MAG: class I SAM-dependent methyltransferase [Clostridia bacterium]|nr:class I SAM-dependent methyltransferase [Clostridia bacterium]
MTDESRIVQSYYDAGAELEWERLEGFSFEFEITRRMMAKYMRPCGRVLDIGGGPGRYSLYLAEKGYEVTLVDLSEGNVALAKAKAAERGLPLRAMQGDARDLSMLGGEQFDYVLLMGPLYHIFRRGDRLRALREARARTLADGLVFAAFIQLFAGLGYFLSECPEHIVDEPQDKAEREALLDYFDALLEGRTWCGPAFTQACFTDLREIRPLMREAGLRTLSLFGQEGVAACNLRELTALPEAARARWLELGLRLCEREEFLSLSSHLMAVAERDGDV